VNTRAEQEQSKGEGETKPYAEQTQGLKSGMSTTLKSSPTIEISHSPCRYNSEL